MGLEADKIKNKRNFYLIPTIKERIKVLKSGNKIKVKSLVENVKNLTLKQIFVRTLRNGKPSKVIKRTREFEIKLPKNLHTKFRKQFWKMGVTIESDHYSHRVHFPEGIPNELKGFGFGYKIYSKLLQTFDYISSADGASDEAKQVWAKLVLNQNVHSVMTNDNVLVMKKSLSKAKKTRIFKKFIAVHCFDDEIKTNRNVLIDDKLIQLLDIPTEFKNPRYGRNSK